MIAKLTEAAARVRGRRYPVVLGALGALTPSDAELEQLRVSCGLVHIDVRAIMLRPDAHVPEQVVPGAIHRTQFRDWLRAKALGTPGLLVTNADDLVSTWPEEDRKAFFREFLHLEMFSDPAAGPIVILLSRYARRYDLPTAPIGQGALVQL